MLLEAIVWKRSPNLEMKQQKKTIILWSHVRLQGEHLLKMEGAIHDGGLALMNITQGNIRHQNTENKIVENSFQSFSVLRTSAQQKQKQKDQILKSRTNIIFNRNWEIKDAHFINIGFSCPKC